MQCASPCHLLFHFFFFNDTATTEIYTLSLHDALPISRAHEPGAAATPEPHHPVSTRSGPRRRRALRPRSRCRDRKSTRLNSSHGYISYAVFCLKKKKEKTAEHHRQTAAKESVDMVMRG